MSIGICVENYEDYQEHLRQMEVRRAIPELAQDGCEHLARIAADMMDVDLVALARSYEGEEMRGLINGYIEVRNIIGGGEIIAK